MMRQFFVMMLMSFFVFLCGRNAHSCVCAGWGWQCADLGYGTYESTTYYQVGESVIDTHTVDQLLKGITGLYREYAYAYLVQIDSSAYLNDSMEMVRLKFVQPFKDTLPFSHKEYRVRTEGPTDCHMPYSSWSDQYAPGSGTYMLLFFDEFDSLAQVGVEKPDGCGHWTSSMFITDSSVITNTVRYRCVPLPFERFIKAIGPPDYMPLAVGNKWTYRIDGYSRGCVGPQTTEIGVMTREITGASVYVDSTVYTIAYKKTITITEDDDSTYPVVYDYTGTATEIGDEIRSFDNSWLPMYHSYTTVNDTFISVCISDTGIDTCTIPGRLGCDSISRSYTGLHVVNYFADHAFDAFVFLPHIGMYKFSNIFSDGHVGCFGASNHTLVEVVVDGVPYRIDADGIVSITELFPAQTDKEYAVETGLPEGAVFDMSGKMVPVGMHTQQPGVYLKVEDGVLKRVLVLD